MRPSRHRAKAVGDLLGPALKGLGMPSPRLTGRVLAAWVQAADPAWRGKTEPMQLEGGVLVVGVASSALREELAQYHRARLLDVLRTALPDLPIVGIRFTHANLGSDDRSDVPGDVR